LSAEQQWPADQVERRALDNLVPHARNSRTHSEEQVAQVAASMREWGWTNPVLVDEDGTIIAGHARVQAARKLGWTEAPVMVARGWTDEQKRAYVIADNKLALNAGWDEAMLGAELQALQASDFDELLTGFSEDELERVLVSEMATESSYPDLADGDREPFQQMTFTLHDDQVEQVKRALEAAKGMGEFGDTGNENSNGNALARVCETFVTQNGDG
jgi:ParB-like chromosome segregation protein Spo0J